MQVPATLTEMDHPPLRYGITLKANSKENNIVFLTSGA